MLGHLWEDLHFAARTMRKNVGFTLLAVITLALGIGANTAIFSVVDPLVLRPLPFHNLNRLVKVWESRPIRGVAHNEVAAANYGDWASQSDVFDDIGAYAFTMANVSGVDVPERLRASLVTPSLLTTIGVQPTLGRLFLPEEGKQGQNHEVILSYAYWQRHFVGNGDVVGKTMLLNGIARTIVGVMPRNFAFPPGVEMWFPYTIAEDLSNRRSHFLYVVARLKQGVSRERAQTELNAIAARLEQQYPRTNTDWRVAVVPLAADVVRDYRQTLVVLMAAVGFLLLIACANIANLILVRTSERQREFAVRAALGASKMRLARQLVTESVLLGMIAGALGIVLAVWGANLLPRLFPTDVTKSIAGFDRIGVDVRALAFTLALSLITPLLFGLAPIFSISRLRANETLKESGGRAGAGRHESALRAALVVAEIGVALVLLIATGLMAKSFVRLLQVNPGFRTDHILTMELTLPMAKYTQDQQVAAFYQQLLERVRALPGVTSAGAIDLLPLLSANATTGVLIEGRPAPPPGEINEVNYREVAPNYFGTIGTPLLEGRTINDSDTSSAPRVIMLNQAAKEKFWPNQDPVGTRVRFNMGGENKWMTVVGIVADVYNQLNLKPKPEIYVPNTQNGSHGMSLVVRSSMDAASLASAVRAQVAALDKDQPVARVRTFDDLRSESVFSSRVPAILLGVFGVIALALAAIGVYGVMAYSVSQRVREIGIRIALGAQPRDVLRLVIGQGLRLAAIGLAIGLAGALALTRLMSSLLFNVPANDPSTFAAITAILAGVALVACYVPARSATRVDPIIAIRND